MFDVVPLGSLQNFDGDLWSSEDAVVAPLLASPISSISISTSKIAIAAQVSMESWIYAAGLWGRGAQRFFRRVYRPLSRPRDRIHHASVINPLFFVTFPGIRLVSSLSP